MSQYLAVALLPRGLPLFSFTQLLLCGTTNMRISLNETASAHLLAFMASRGISNPTHGLNVLITLASLNNLIPTSVDTNGNSREQQQPT